VKRRDVEGDIYLRMDGADGGGLGPASHGLCFLAPHLDVGPATCTSLLV